MRISAAVFVFLAVYYGPRFYPSLPPRASALLPEARPAAEAKIRHAEDHCVLLMGFDLIVGAECLYVGRR